MKKSLQFILLFGLSVLVLTGCISVSSAKGPLTNAPTPIVQETQAPTTIREAQVDRVEIQLSQTDPVRVSAVVHGNLSESCAKLGDIQTSYAANTFQIKLYAVSPSDRGCIQMMTHYKQAVNLDMTGLTPGTYIVVANGVSTSFNYPSGSAQVLTPIHLVVATTDQAIRIVDFNLPLNQSTNPFFNGFLPSGASAAGIAYVLNPFTPGLAEAIGSNGVQELSFVHNPTLYGLAIWRGSSDAQFHLAWGTQPGDFNQASALMLSSMDGSQLESPLSAGAADEPVQLVPELWSADGQWLYFSKEPVGLGGYILFSGASNLYKINISTSEVVELIPQNPPDGPQACLDSISADYRFVADHCSQNTITVRDLTSGGTSSIQPPADVLGFKFVGSAHFSLDGSRLAYALAKGDQNNEQGWVAVSEGTSGASKLILTSAEGSYYSVAGWLDDQTLLVQSTNLQDCSPYCASELWTVGIDGSNPQKVADGSLLTVITGSLGAVPQPQSNPAPTSAACQDAAKYISDDGIDGTTYAPNTPFTKTWTLKNTGTCTWDSTYLVYQLSGAFMTQQPGYWIVPQGHTVEPGQTVDISVGMTAPPDNGNFVAYWGLKNGAGQVIPVEGGADDNSFYVDINVNDGEAEGAVTATSINIVPEQGSGEACTADSTYFVHVSITTDGPTTASYEIGSSAGQISAGYFEDENGQSAYVTGSLQFAKAGTKTINLRFVGPYPYPDDISILLRVNDGEWSSLKLNCP